MKFVPDFGERPVHFIEGCGNYVIQIIAKATNDGFFLQCTNMAGEVKATLTVPSEVSVFDVQYTIAEKLSIEFWRLRAVLPSGQLLNDISQCENFGQRVVSRIRG